MTTIILIKSDEQQPTVREVLDSVVDPDEQIHFLRLPTVRCLGPLIQEINPMINYDVEYTISCLPEGYDVSELVEFAIESDANRICIGISEKTMTGKARIDDLVQSVLLYEGISGDLVVGDHVITLEELEYGE
ncbi:hypothetical protein MUK72_17515 (plasmid) [Halococcus dombrowskii]|uniref:Uncharacterized protein n=1 Tax=Halococcus dombrowskii TaxID=179637 RepID=A0AAV3SJE9_HALDO|nr:hypothetical protein [Halococcus dombrowskii]UOO96996.1 hypothetical protein MUK72_17515 [Halococcus dombrowskii]